MSNTKNVDGLFAYSVLSIVRTIGITTIIIFIFNFIASDSIYYDTSHWTVDFRLVVTVISTHSVTLDW